MDPLIKVHSLSAGSRLCHLVGYSFPRMYNLAYQKGKPEELDIEPVIFSFTAFVNSIRNQKQDASIRKPN